jgi:hypothetical protein
MGICGLYVHSLGEIPSGAKRNYYVYLLDYGWDEPLGQAVRANIPQMADRASRSNSAVIHGPRGTQFADEVLSWHQINGEPAEDLLPAILITTRHPRTIKESQNEKQARAIPNDALLLIPLKKTCSSAGQVVELVDRIFRDIKKEKNLTDFSVAKRMRRGVGRAIVDAVILRPNVNGIGIDLKKLFSGAGGSGAK